MYVNFIHLLILFLVLSRAEFIAAQQGLCFGALFPKNACLPIDPKTFIIADFTTFIPADDNPLPSSTSFRYSDDTDPQIMSCFSPIQKRKENNFSSQSNKLKISFTYSGNKLRISRGYIACSRFD